MPKISNADLRIQGDVSGADSVITTAELQKTLSYGTKFVWVSNTQVKLSPSGPDGYARVNLYDGSAYKGFLITADVTAAITSSGANGLDTGAEAANTFYCVWGIGKSDGTFALLLSVSTTSPTLPTGYTFKRLLWGVANNNSSNFVGFEHLRNGKCVYTDTETSSVRGINVLTAGTGVATTAISMAKGAPATTNVAIGALLNAIATDTTVTLLTWSEDSGATVDIVPPRNLGGSASGGQQSHCHWAVVLRNTGSLATSLYYTWSANRPSRSTNVWIVWWSIGTRW